MEFEDLIQGVIDLRNQDVTEFNELHLHAEKLQSENDELRSKQSETDLVMASQHEALEVAHANNKVIGELNLKVSELSDSLLITKRSLATSQSELAKLTTENKRLEKLLNKAKETNKTKQTKIDRLIKTKNVSPEGDVRLGRLPVVYQVGRDSLSVFPERRTITVDGVSENQIFLLYTNGNGCYLSATLMGGGEVAFSSFTDPDNLPAERTQKTINKYTMSVPELVKQYAREWLYRVNVTQRKKLTNKDLLCQTVKN